MSKVPLVSHVISDGGVLWILLICAVHSNCNVIGEANPSHLLSATDIVAA